MFFELNKKDKVYILPEYIYENEYITEKEIESINKLVGVKNFICYPKRSELECGDVDELVATILLPIMIDVFSSGLFESLKLAVIEVTKKIRKRIIREEDVKYNFDFHIYDENSGFKIDLSTDVDASAKEIEGILDKAKEIAEIIKK